MRSAVFIKYHGLAVDDRAADAKAFGCFSDRWKAVGPVVAASRDDPDAVRFDMDGEPIGVPLDLVDPVMPRKR